MFGFLTPPTTGATGLGTIQPQIITLMVRFSCTAHFGIPVSTTHTITGAIVGVGASRRLSAVHWGVTRRIVWAWILTIPGAAIFGAGLFKALTHILP